MYSISQQNVENLTASFDSLHAPSSGAPNVINEKAVMNEEAVRCISCEKDHPSDYCPNTISESYKPLDPGYTVVGTRRGPPEPPRVMNEEPVHCYSCKKDHPTYAFCCPYTPCTICFKTGHYPFSCPYLRKIPKDADFDRANYEITCECGNLFNADKWACTRCPTRCPAVVGAQLVRKFCNICCESAQHSFFECPKDKVRAAALKSIRDRFLSRPRFPYVSEEEASASQRDSECIGDNVTFIEKDVM